MHSTTNPEMRHGVRCGRRTLRKQVPPNPGTARDRWEAAPREFMARSPVSGFRTPQAPMVENRSQPQSRTGTHKRLPWPCSIRISRAWTPLSAEAGL